MKINNNNMLDTLYDLFQERLDYKMDEPEIISAKEQIAATVKNAETYEDIQGFVLDYGIAYERAGFRNVFHALRDNRLIQIYPYVFRQKVGTGKRKTIHNIHISSKL